MSVWPSSDDVDEEPTDEQLDGAVTDPYDADSYQAIYYRELTDYEERADQARKGDWE